MTALPQDVVADLKRRIAELERKLETSRDRQTGSAEILRTIAGASGDAETALHQIAETTARLFGGQSVRIRIAESGEWVRTIAVGASAERLGLEVSAMEGRIGGKNLPSTVVLENRQIHIPDLDNLDPSMADWPGLPPARAAGARTMVGTPLRREGNAIGVLIVYRYRLAPFTADELALLQSFADQAVIAIQNARLFNETQEALQHQTATSEVLQVIGSSMADAQPVLERILDIAQKMFDSDGVAVFLAPGDGLLHLAARRGGRTEAIDAVFPLPIEQTAAPSVIGERQQRYFPDVMHGAAVPQSLRQAAQAMGNFSVAITPMLWEGRGIGMISVTREPKTPFNAKELSLLRTFADQAVIAIENARLFNEVQARTRELSTSLDDLRTAQDRLVQTEKLASLGQLTAGIAHEIKNPLNFVNNFSALSAELVDELNEVLEPAALDDTMRQEIDELTQMLKDNLQKVVQHGKRADSIVKNMLLHSREGSGEHRSADINALLDESLNLAYHGARAEKPHFNVTLQRQFDAGAGMIEVFPQEIIRVFLNLITNGFYAVAKRKSEAGHSGFDPILSAATRNLGNHVEIRIRDNGTGIPADVKEKMFNPFFTTKPAGEGTGLGLSMSHDIIVKQHGGTIDVETEPGQFTEFTIVLPRTSGSSKQD
jgi:two-component system, NtrC family, sensor kinase